MALNTKRKEYMMTLNVELETNNNSKSQNEDVALNAKPKNMYDGYEFRTRNKRRP